MSLIAAAEKPRVFLFLQGPASPIFAKIASHLEAAGHRCFRINLNVGDWIFWRRRGARNFRGKLAAWPAFIEAFMSSRGVTDIVLMGDERSYHRIAVDIAKAKNIDVTVVEMGYLRPDWITVERDGISSNSRFPNDRHLIQSAAGNMPPPATQTLYPQSFFKEAVLDLVYNLPNVFLSLLFPHYRRHAVFHPLMEYAGWIARLTTGSRQRVRAERVIETVIASGNPFFVYPLQLETDYQLRAHSPYRSQSEAITEILHSFCAHAASNAELVIKVHPLDNALINWKRKIDELSASLRIEGRVHYIDGGDLNVLSRHCKGMVTVNSTAVLNGLRLGVPVKVLGCAIYDVDGMTHQGTLDSFWEKAEIPDPDLTQDFFRLVAASIQVRGNFCSRAGIDAGARSIADKLLSRQVNLPGGDWGFAPRKKPLKSSSCTK